MIWIVILMVLGPTNVYAETCDNVTFELPPHDRVDNGSLFYFDSTKELLQKLDCGEYHYRMRKIEKEQLGNEVLQNGLLKDIIVLYEEKQGMLEVENTRIYEKWRLDNKKLHEAENKVDYSWLGWTASAIFATTTLSFGIAFVLK